MNVCEFLPVEAAQRANQRDATGSSESSPGRVAEDAGVSDPPLTWESRRVCVCYRGSPACFRSYRTIQGSHVLHLIVFIGSELQKQPLRRQDIFSSWPTAALQPFRSLFKRSRQSSRRLTETVSVL